MDKRRKQRIKEDRHALLCRPLTLTQSCRRWRVLNYVTLSHCWPTTQARPHGYGSWLQTDSQKNWFQLNRSVSFCGRDVISYTSSLCKHKCLWSWYVACICDHTVTFLVLQRHTVQQNLYLLGKQNYLFLINFLLWYSNSQKTQISETGKLKLSGRKKSVNI